MPVPAGLPWKNLNSLQLQLQPELQLSLLSFTKKPCVDRFSAQPIADRCSNIGARAFENRTRASARSVVVASDTRLSSHDRRGPNRPLNGDRRPCAACGNTARFEERYTVARRGLIVRDPAWVCRRCGDETFVRRRGSAHSRSAPIRRGLAVRRRDERGELRRALNAIRARNDAMLGPVITARKRLRALLVEVAAGLFVSVLAADSAGRLLDANPAACALIGIPHDDLLHRRLVDLFCGDPQRFGAAWRRFLTAREFAGVCRLRQASGGLVTVECVASAHLLPGVHVATLASRRMLHTLE
jgi:PAS domain-containing protein